MKQYLVAGPDGVQWSIWDHGDELCVTAGPSLLDRLVVKVSRPVCRKMDAAHKWQHVVSAAGAIHVAKSLGGDPVFRLLWKS